MKNIKYITFAFCLFIASNIHGSVALADTKETQISDSSNVIDFNTKAPESNYIILEPELKEGDIPDSNCYIGVDTQHYIIVYTTKDDPHAMPIPNKEGVIEYVKLVPIPPDYNPNPITYPTVSDKFLNFLIGRHIQEYGRLMKEHFRTDQNAEILGYLDLSGIKLTEEIIEVYKKEGYNGLNKILSPEYKIKYNISEDEAKYVSDFVIKGFESFSIKVNIPVQKLIDDYIEHEKTQK